MASSSNISFNSTFGSLDISTENAAQNMESSANESKELIDKIIFLYLRHNLSLVCLEDCMKLYNEGREDCDKLPTDKKQIMKLFHENRELLKMMYFVKCGKCKKTTKIDAESSEKFKCCDKILKKTEKNFFVYLPIQAQIKRSIKNNWSYISKFDTTTEKTDSYSDAHDGEILKNILNQYKDSDVNILSLCLNLDGANKFKSNSVSLWPIQLTQNFLPPEIRFIPNNIIVAGLYYSDVKLKCMEYLLPLVDELNNLKENEIKMNIENQLYTFKPIVTHCAVDLPAKSMLQETKQYGSYDGCTFCEIPGELVSIQKPKNNKKKIGKKIESNTKESPKENIEEEEKPNKFVRYVEGSEPFKLRDEADTLRKMLIASNFKKKKPWMV